MRPKAALVALLAFTAVGSFAMLGEKGKDPKKRTLLLNQVPVNKGSFSLKSGYTFRGSQIINPNNANNYINLNTVVTYEKANSTLIIPLKKKIYINSTGSGIVLHH